MGVEIIEKNYIDVTEEWIKELYYFEYKGVKYIVDGKKQYLIILKKKERQQSGQKILLEVNYMLPRISIADYLWNGKYWDLKEINGNSKQALYHAIRKKYRQSSNFIFDISKSNISIMKEKFKYIIK